VRPINPIARALRDPAFRARQRRNRKKYTRKTKHQAKPESEETQT
jgi:stalled ribosome alternative rescue factor ArfA